MAQTNIYAQKQNGDLKLLAEVDGESDPALAVDALLDEMPRLKQRQFVVIDTDDVMLVEAGDEVVQPRRKIEIQPMNSGGALAEPDEEEAEEDEDDELEEEEEEAPQPQQRRRRKPAAKKPAAKRSTNGRKSASKGRKSPFKANPASAE